MTHFPLPPWRFFPERRAGDRLLPLREPGPLGRENKRPLLAQDPEPGALVSPPPHLAPNIAAKGFSTGRLHAGRRTLPRSRVARPHPPDSPAPGAGLFSTPVISARLPAHRPPLGFGPTVLAPDTSAYGGKRNFAVSASRRGLPFTSCLGPRKVVLTPALCVSLCGVDPGFR